MVGSVKAVKAGKIAKRQGQLASDWANVCLQQRFKRPCAAQLIAMHEGSHHHATAWLATVKLPDAFDPGIAIAPMAQLRFFQCKLRSHRRALFFDFGKIDNLFELHRL